ncbi:hypothetical protein ACFYSH_27970 [Streptomyces sp. NPDC005791]|uniref:hypothetical protein n=1 Tax=unclassified Streptomyces TaxID=2593676 RepID=UPI0033C5B246
MRKPASRACRAVRLAALTVLAAGPLVSCGIQETAVIEAGSPAVADLLPPREGRVLLFFYSSENELLPVPRTVDTPGGSGSAGVVGADDPPARRDPLPVKEGTSPRAAVTALLAGPDEAERRAGFHNAPSLPRTASATDRIVKGERTVEVELRLPVAHLTAPARDQLVCTAAYAAHAQGAVSVSLVGQEGRLAPADCPVRPVAVPAR